MASPSWNPNATSVNEICAVLIEYMNPAANQALIIHKLTQCQQLPDFHNYLVWILCKAEDKPSEVRQSAGLLLKTNLKANYPSVSPSSQHYVKSLLLPCIGLPDRQLRATVGTTISMLVEMEELNKWPELLPALVQCIDSNDYNYMEGALDALFKICEDQPVQLDHDIPGMNDRPINIFFPRLLQLFTNPHTNLRRLALACLNNFIYFLPTVFYTNMDKYLQGIFTLSSDASGDIRKLVCSGLLLILEIEPDALSPHMKNVVNYMLQAISDPDPDVALEACEFWTLYNDTELPLEPIREVLPNLIPVLLSKMVYTDDDDEVIEAEENAPVRDQDLKPRFHASKNRNLNGEEDEKDEDVLNSWTLRKCSASSIDALSLMFNDEMLPILLPLVHNHLQDKSDNTWKEREASILVMGAISEGCIHGLLPLVPQIVNTLLPHLNDPRPLVKSITCWTLSRYSKWIVQNVNKPEGQAQFDQVLSSVLNCVLDDNRKVQKASCSAFATLEEESGDLLIPKLEPILQHLMFAYRKYDLKNLRVVYDALGILADSVGRDLANPKYLEILMPPLIEKWNQVQDHDRDIFSLLEVLTSIAQALGTDFVPYSESIFIRCNTIIKNELIAKSNPAQSAISYDKEFVICSLDLLSGIADALGASVETLVSRSNVTDILLQCVNDESNEIRQSAFALIGDLSKSCIVHLKPRLNDFLVACTNQLEVSNIVQEKISVVNNACWALGEMTIKVKSEVSPIVVHVLKPLVHILNSAQGLNKSLIENTAITLGRLSLACPDLISPHIDHFFNAWCLALATIRDDIEKEDAFKGLCALVRLNPNAAVKYLVGLLQAIASWHEIRCDALRNEVTQILQGFKQMLQSGPVWDQSFTVLDPPMRTKLSSKYGI